MPEYDLLIVGAGIAGSTLAALTSPHLNVALIDRDIASIPGSTGHAPGVVAQINSVDALTELARRSVSYYRRIPGGFHTVGGLEVALGRGETRASLVARATLAHSRGLQAEILSTEQAQALCPAFVRDDAVGAVHFPTDGVANARLVTQSNHEKARKAGAALIDGNVEAITPSGEGWVVSLAGGRKLTAAHVAVCTGAWAGQLLPHLDAAAVAVAHPYAFGSRRPPRPRPDASNDLLRAPAEFQPFVRFPGQTTYARDHGDRDGLGTYAHPPVHVRGGTLASLASGVAYWDTSFDAHVDCASTVLPDETAVLFNGPRIMLPPGTKGAGWEVMKSHDVPFAFTGLMTMTPDGMPICGKIRDGARGALWCLVGTWVTHAAGSAGVLAPQILAAMGKRKLGPDDAWLRAALDPHRFDGMRPDEQERHCLDKYRDIWNRKEQCLVLTGRAGARAKM